MTQVKQIGLRWSNAFLILGRKMVLVDTGCPEDEKTILNSISDAGKQVSDLSLILHTHIHIDHCGCTATLKQKSNALVAIHRSESQTFLERKNAPIIPINWLGKILSPIVRDGHQPCEIDILIDDALDLHPYGIDGKAIATPGHTPGSISIILDNGEVIAGDLLGGGRLLGLFQPGRPRYHHWYSDLDAAQKSIAQVMNIKPVKIYAGHGGPLDGQSAIDYFSRKENVPNL
ncbi:MAG: MBL fold metallo-hydrolase [Desulfobacula sp.]|nr:MBL fold metallo-hydrolase [Desulfobacula sp.]